MPAFGFQFFHTFRTIESPTTVQFIVIVTFRHDAIPENFPGIVVVKGTDFVLRFAVMFFHPYSRRTLSNGTAMIPKNPESHGQLNGEVDIVMPPWS